MTLWPKVVCCLVADGTRWMLDQIADLLDGGDTDDGIPEKCLGCGARRPNDPFRWELWEALHEDCEPLFMGIPW